MKLHKDFGYESPKYDVGWGVINAKLRGVMADLNNNLSVSGSPYELLIWFESNKNIEGCVILIEKTVIYDVKEAKKVVDGYKKIRFKSKSKGRYVAAVVIGNIKLEYLDYKVDLIYRGLDDCSEIIGSSEIGMMFNRKYEEREISFWDSLMGV